MQKSKSDINKNVKIGPASPKLLANFARSMFYGSAKTDEPSEMLFWGRIVWVHKTRIRWGAIGVIWRIRRNDLRRGMRSVAT